MQGLRVRVALVCGDGADAGEDDGVLLHHDVAVVQRIFLRRLCKVAVAVLRREAELHLMKVIFPNVSAALQLCQMKVAFPAFTTLMSLLYKMWVYSIFVHHIVCLFPSPSASAVFACLLFHI